MKRRAALILFCFLFIMQFYPLVGLAEAETNGEINVYYQIVESTDGVYGMKDGETTYTVFNTSDAGDVFEWFTYIEGAYEEDKSKMPEFAMNCSEEEKNEWLQTSVTCDIHTTQNPDSWSSVLENPKWPEVYVAGERIQMFIDNVHYGSLRLLQAEFASHDWYF